MPLRLFKGVHHNPHLYILSCLTYLYLCQQAFHPASPKYGHLCVQTIAFTHSLYKLLCWSILKPLTMTQSGCSAPHVVKDTSETMSFINVAAIFSM